MPRSNAVLDNFNRASIGANWSAQPLNDSAANLTIQASVAVGGSGYDYAWWNVSQFSDQTDAGIEAAIAISTLMANNGAAWLSLLQQPSAAASTADGYELAVTRLSGNDQVQIFRYLNSTPTTILDQSPAVEWASGDLLIVRRSNTGLLSVIRDRAGTETLVASIDDDTYTGSFFAGGGYFDGTGTIRLDDFSAGNFSAGGAGQTITATGIATAEAVGTPTVTAGGLTISPGGIPTAEAVGTPTVTPGNVTLSPPGAASAEAFGTPTLTPGPVTITPVGIPSQEAFGHPSLIGGVQAPPNELRRVPYYPTIPEHPEIAT